MEDMNYKFVEHIINRLVIFLKRENVYIREIKVLEKKSKFEIHMVADPNYMNISKIKVIFSKNKLKYRVFTGKTSLDLRLRKFIDREALKVIKSREISTQEEDSGSSVPTGGVHKIHR